jgi:hypothetical protein
LSSSQASSTWYKLHHSVGRHMKMQVHIYRISWRLEVQSSSRTSLKTSYYSVCSHSHSWEEQISGSMPIKKTSTHG